MAEDTPDKPELDFGEDSAKTSQAAPPQSQEAAPDLDFTKARELTQPSEQEEKPENPGKRAVPLEVNIRWLTTSRQF